MYRLGYQTRLGPCQYLERETAFSEVRVSLEFYAFMAIVLVIPMGTLALLLEFCPLRLLNLLRLQVRQQVINPFLVRF